MKRDRRGKRKMAEAVIDFETDLDEETLERFDFDLPGTALLAAREVLRFEGCPFDAEASLLVTGSSRIREVNRDMRGLDAVTDVLSFPVCEYDEPGDFSPAEADRAGCFDPENGRLMLGDILINADRVFSQAEEYGHSARREFAFLVVHSLLHLTGYDHMTEEDEQRMTMKQKEILEALNITRESQL